MAKAGRKRKAGVRRERNGRASRAEQGDAIRGVAMRQPHRRWLAPEQRKDHRAESVTGRLFLAGVISEAEQEAADRLRKRRNAFLALLATPMTARSAAGQMVAASMRSDDAESGGLSDLPETEEERRERVLAQWELAARTLARALGGGKAEFARVIAVCCDDEWIPANDEAGIASLRAALSALALRWGLTDAAEGAEAGTPGLRPMRASGAEKAAWGRAEREVPVHYVERA